MKTPPADPVAASGSPLRDEGFHESLVSSYVGRAVEDPLLLQLFQ